MRATGGGAGLESKREDEGVEKKSERGMDLAEENECCVMAALVDIRG